jgi:MFS superfamily sulfate permease-like transporter
MGELTLGVLQGIAIGVVLSLLRLIYLASRPKGTALGQLPGTEAYRDVRIHRDAITFPTRFRAADVLMQINTPFALGLEARPVPFSGGAQARAL